MKKRYAVIVILVLVLLFFIIRTGSKNEDADKAVNNGAVYVIGIDGADWEIIDFLMAQGELPTFRYLMDNGSYGPLQTDVGLSPISWTTIATGKRHENYGIPDADPATIDELEYELFAGTVTITAQRIWDIAASYGKMVGVFKWYLASSVRDNNGFWVSYGYPEGGLYPQYIKPLVDQFGDDSVPYLMSIFPCDLITAFIEEESDHEQHRFFLYHTLYKEMCQSKSGTQERANTYLGYAEHIYERYRIFDRRLRAIVDKMGPDDHIVVVSDHGIELSCYFERQVQLPDNFLTVAGLQTTWDIDTSEHNESNVVCRERAAARVDMVDVTVKKQVVTTRVSETFLGINDYPEIVYEPTVRFTFSAEGETADRIQTVMSSIRENLLRLRIDKIPVFSVEVDEKTGSLVCVLSEPFLAFIRQNNEYANYGFIIVSILNGNHGPDAEGIILMAGKDIKPGYEITGAALYDVTPTVLYLMGLPVARDMDGNVLSDAIKSTALLFHPPKYIETYEDSMSKTPPATEVQINKGKMNQEKEALLRSLGYLN